MALSKIKAVFRYNVQDVWNIVTDLEKYQWRSDLSKIDIIDEKQFVEYTKDGYATTFTTTIIEPLRRWEFDMENGNMKGHWTGIFTSKDEETEVDFTEDVTAKKIIMKPFVKTFLKKQQELYINDLTKELERVYERFLFRNILPQEADQAARIEEICFPPNEACSEKMMRERVAKAPELFLVAIDRQSGRIAGFLNGLSTNEGVFRDEFFIDAELYDPNGKNVMLLGLDVLPEYRGQGLAREIVLRYLRREHERGRESVILTCLDSKVKMYEGMGFVDRGIAQSSWGGEQWHEMCRELNR